MAGQTWIFLLSIVLGAVLGVCYDVFRILRIAVPHPAGVIFAEDLIYGIFCAFGTFLFLLTTEYGEIRLFLLAGEGVGFALYYCTLGVLVLKAAKGIIAAVRWLCRLLFRIFIAPLLFLGRCLCRFLGKIGGFFARKAKNGAKISNTYLKRCRSILYNHSKHLRRKDGKNEQRG